MPWQKLMVERARRLSATGTLSIDLPRSHPIGTVGFRAILGGTTPTFALDRVRVTADGGAALWDTEGGEARGIGKFYTGSAQLGTVNADYIGILNMGRFPRDEDVMIPEGFSTLQLALDVTLGDTSPTADVDVWVDQLIGGRPRFSKRVVKVLSEAVSASEIVSARLPIGAGLLRSVYLHTDDTDNVDGQPIELRVNGGSEVPFSMVYRTLIQDNIDKYRFHDNDVPDEAELSNREGGGSATTDGEKLVVLDNDVLDDLRQARSLARADGISDLIVQTTADSAGTSGDVGVIVEQVFPVRRVAAAARGRRVA